MSSGQSQRRVLIVGAGLAGSLVAIYLARQGCRVRLFERRDDPRRAGYVGGRSINLALSARGLWGLEGVGLDRHVLERDAIRMPGRMLHGVDGKLTFQPYSKDPRDAINSVSRGGLNITLLNAAEREPGVEIEFGARCTDVDLERNAALFETSGGERVQESADLIVGADGAYSPVRFRLQRNDRFEYSQSYLSTGYKELSIPAGPGGAFVIERDALHIWPRGASLMIALPNRDGSFTNTLFWPFEGEHSFAMLERELADRRGAARPGEPMPEPTRAERDRVWAHFERWYGDAVRVMPTIVDDFFTNPTGSLVTVRCSPWRHVNKDGKGVVILGDAAHAIVPFYGQGMNCAFEDCRVLAELLRPGGWEDLDSTLVEFERLRKPNADAIADMAIENFYEMGDKVGRPEFLYRKRVEQAIHDMFPDRVFPQYNLVSFSIVPYAEARARGRELERLLDRIVPRVPMVEAEGMDDTAWRARVREAAEREMAAAAGA